MKNFKFKCRKCGHIIEIPEKTESVLCGNCVTWNRPRNFFTALDITPQNEAAGGSILQKVPGSVYSEIPGQQGGPVYSEIPGQHGSADSAGTSPAEDERVNPAPGFLSTVALLFFLAPLLSIIVAKLKLPPFVTFAVLAAVIMLYQLRKKRS